MRKIKKLTSLILAVLLVCSVTTVSFGSVSAVVDENGCYAPGENVEETYRYYFAMPDDWYNSNTDTAGIYCFTGADICGFVEGAEDGLSWPGYKAQRGDIENLYYFDCPTDVPAIVWNNYVNGGLDENAPIYSAAKQANDANVEGYCNGDSDLYTTEWFEEMYESFKGDKAKLGDFADNFFYDVEIFGEESFKSFTFNMDNMIFVIDPSQTSENFYGKKTYVGEWYFYYGNGEYGIYPTREESAYENVLLKLNSESEATVPSVTEPVPANPKVPTYTNGKIYFDVKKSGWNLNTNKVFYCHIWKADGNGLWTEWQTRSEQCSFDKETGIATYDLSKTGNTIKESDGRIYCVIFSSNTGMQTYNTVMSGACIGDTMYCTGEQIENPEDSEKKANVAVWENNPDCGPKRLISSTGNIVGTAYCDNESDESLLAEFLINYSYDTDKLEMYTQKLLDEIKCTPEYMLDLVHDMLYLAVDYGQKDKKTADAQYKRISRVLDSCSDPNAKAPSLTFSKLTLGVGEKSKINVWKNGVIIEGGSYVYEDLSDFRIESSNYRVAAVDSQGNITAKGAGIATITVTDLNGKFAQCEITVKSAPSSVKVANSGYTLGKGDTLEIRALTNSSSWCTNYKWSSSNTNVVTVGNPYSNRVSLRAIGTGTATVTVKTYNGKTASCKVTVKNAPSSIKINPASVTLGVGEKLTISESTNSGSYAHNGHLIWRTSNDKVVTVVRGSGNKAELCAVGTGTADVTITTYNKKTATCRVTVKSAPTSVKLSSSSVTLGKGESYTISEGTNSGSYANASNLKWSSSNTKVATVTKGSGNKAIIKATGVGTAYVKITLYNGKTAQCKVTVKNAPASVRLSKTNLTLNKGASYTISEGTSSGSYANASNLKWSSSNTKVATVTKGNGNKAVIKANAKGTAYIKITLYNGKTAQCKVTVK